MKIKIGPYKEWFGPYQLSYLLRYIGVSESACDWLAQKLPAGPFEWLDSFKKRKVKINLDRYDTWCMDHTLALIIHPMLVQLKEFKHGAPFVDDEDVPDELKSTAAPKPETEGDVDDNHFKRWDWVLDEMIWTFSEYSKEGGWDEEFYWLDVPVEKKGLSLIIDNEKFEKKGKRIENGMRLFGKYYSNLWD